MADPGRPGHRSRLGGSTSPLGTEPSSPEQARSFSRTALSRTGTDNLRRLIAEDRFFCVSVCWLLRRPAGSTRSSGTSGLLGWPSMFHVKHWSRLLRPAVLPRHAGRDDHGLRLPSVGPVLPDPGLRDSRGHHRSCPRHSNWPDKLDPSRSVQPERAAHGRAPRTASGRRRPHRLPFPAPRHPVLSGTIPALCSIPLLRLAPSRTTSVVSPTLPQSLISGGRSSPLSRLRHRAGWGSGMPSSGREP